MKKIAHFLIEKRIVFFSIMMALLIASIVGMFFVNINDDESTYLPSDSPMRKGLSVMNAQFSQTNISEENESFKLMFKSLTDQDKLTIYNEILAYSDVETIDFNVDNLDDPKYNKDEYTLYVIHTTHKSTKATAKLMKRMKKHFHDYKLSAYYANAAANVLSVIVPVAFAIVIFILIMACKSLMEPIIILVNIAIAIIINMGSNALLPSVSSTTNSIAAVMQLILSIDYSIIFINRYRQEKANSKTPISAIESAVRNGFSSILASSLTTFLGLLALCLMSFKIGQDMGIVLAKGVFVSLICIFTILPQLLLWAEPLTQKMERKLLKEKFKEYKSNRKNKKESEVADYE